MIVTSEYVCNNIKLDEINRIKGNTRLEYDQKSGKSYHKRFKVMCIIKIFDKIKNEVKNITIECYNVLGEYNKIMQSSRGM